MKILLVASTMVHIKNFHLPYVERFAELGHDVSLMTSSENAEFYIPFKKKAFSFKNFRLSFKIRKILKKEKFDAVFVHTTLAAFWTRFAMKGLKNKPIVVNTVHGYLFSKDSSYLKRKIYLFAERFVRKCTDYIFVMNEEDMEIATKHKLCKKEVVFIDGMGVNLNRVSVSEKKAPRETLNLVYVGELNKRKNQIFLVKSLTELENARLTLVGDGDERKNIEKYAKKNGVLNRLEITGFTKNVKFHLENADIYTSASTIEGLPFNIIEAMSAKMPIVASDIKGQRDLLPKEQLYSLNDMEAFVKLVKSTPLDVVDYDIKKYKFETVFNKNVDLYISTLEK